MEASDPNELTQMVFNTGLTHLFIYLSIYIDTNNSGLKVPGHY